MSSIFKPNENNIKAISKMVKETFEQIVDRSCKRAVLEMRQQFIRNRMPITEVMYPNEEVVDEDEDEQDDSNIQDGKFHGKPLADSGQKQIMDSKQQEDESESYEDSDDEDPNNEDGGGQNTQSPGANAFEDFTYIKVVSP